MTTFTCPLCHFDVRVLFRVTRDGQPVMVCRPCWKETR